MALPISFESELERQLDPADESLSLTYSLFALERHSDFLSSQHNCKSELYAIPSLVQCINGSYQFVEETRDADYPDTGFLEPVPEPRTA
jgi:hypothetical protein